MTVHTASPEHIPYARPAKRRQHRANVKAEAVLRDSKGGTVREISEQLGVLHDSIYRWARKAGIQRRAHALTAEQTHIAQRLLRFGFTCAETVEELGDDVDIESVRALSRALPSGILVVDLVGELRRGGADRQRALSHLAELAEGIIVDAFDDAIFEVAPELRDAATVRSSATYALDPSASFRLTVKTDVCFAHSGGVTGARASRRRGDALEHSYERIRLLLGQPEEGSANPNRDADLWPCVLGESPELFAGAANWCLYGSVVGSGRDSVVRRGHIRLRKLTLDEDAELVRDRNGRGTSGRAS